MIVHTMRGSRVTWTDAVGREVTLDGDVLVARTDAAAELLALAADYGVGDDRGQPALVTVWRSNSGGKTWATLSDVLRRWMTPPSRTRRASVVDVLALFFRPAGALA